MSENYTPKLGQLATETDHRDAIHIAVIPVRASWDGQRGDQVKVKQIGNEYVTTDEGEFVGIADPFLKGKWIEKGDIFWLLLFPETITGLRHVWSHPAFQEETNQPTDIEKQRAEEWLRELAERLGRTCTNYDEPYKKHEWIEITYEMLIQSGHDAIEDGGYFVQQGSEMARDVFQNKKTKEKFWKMWQIVTGVKITKEQGDHGIFSCSC